MCDSSLSDIAVLSVESKRSHLQAIDFDAVVDEFDARHHNRKLALHRVWAKPKGGATPKLLCGTNVGAPHECLVLTGLCCS